MTLKLVLSDLKYDLKSTVFTLVCVLISSVMTSFMFAVSETLCRAELARGTDAASAAGVLFVSAFITVSVTLAGCFMIYSAVSVSFERKLKFIGTLSSLGASSGQKAAVLSTEAGIYAFFGALCGTAAGGSLSASLLSRLKTAFTEFSSYDLDLDPAVLPVTFLFCFTAVMLSALKPVRRLKKIDVSDVLRGKSAVNIALKDGIFTLTAEKLFGYYGRLAGQFYENDRKKYRAVLAALAFGEGLLFFFRSFFEYEKQRGGSGADKNGLFAVYAISAPVLLLCAAASFAIFVSAYESKKREYAALVSVGASLSDIYRIIFIESLYFLSSVFVVTALSTVVGSYAMLTFERISDPGAVYMFSYPFAAYPVCAVVNTAAAAALIIYGTLKTARLDVISLVKDAE